MIALVVGAVIAMQKFVQRGLQARTRDAVHYMVTNNAVSALGNTGQYVPYYEDSQYDTTRNDVEMKAGNGTAESFDANAQSTRTGRSNVTYDEAGTVGNGMQF